MRSGHIEISAQITHIYCTSTSHIKCHMVQQIVCNISCWTYSFVTYTLCYLWKYIPRVVFWQYTLLLKICIVRVFNIVLLLSFPQKIILWCVCIDNAKWKDFHVIFLNLHIYFILIYIFTLSYVIVMCDHFFVMSFCVR